LAASEVRMEAGPELEQRPDTAAHRDAPRGRLHDPCEEPEQGRLAGAVAADQADRAPGLDVEGHVPEGPDVAAARAAAAEHEVLEGAALARVDAEAARRALDRDLPRCHP